MTLSKEADKTFFVFNPWQSAPNVQYVYRWDEGNNNIPESEPVGYVREEMTQSCYNTQW